MKSISSMRNTLLVVAALAIPHLATAQKAPAPAYSRYATVIVNKADSAVHFLTAQVGTMTDASAVGALATGATRAKRLSSEFAAFQPPADLAALHRELADILNIITTKADRAANLMQAAMNASTSDEQRTTAAETAQHDLSDLQSATISYQEIRERLESALLTHGVTLPNRR